MELYAPHLLTLYLISRNLYFIRRSDLFEIIRNSGNRITVAHPYLRAVTHSFQQHIIFAERSQMSTSIFTCTRRFHFSTIGIRQILRTITDTQYRIFTTNLTQIDFKRIFIVNRKRTARKDYPFNCRIIFWKFVVRNDFAICIQFAHTTTYKLCCLRTEIKNYYFFLHINGWILNK